MSQNQNPEYLFLAERHAYYDTPHGCLRTIRIDGDTFVGARFGKTYEVPLSQITPVTQKAFS